jgi:hypothetical protein
MTFVFPTLPRQQRARQDGAPGGIAKVLILDGFCTGFGTGFGAVCVVK